MSLRFVIALALAVCAAARDVSLRPNRLQLCGVKDPMMNPTLEVLHGQETVWQIPPSPVAILFLAHGWNCDPFSFFDRSLGCPKCYGLPEDRTLALDALWRGYAVISVKSIGAHYNNWPIETSEDVQVVENILHDWRLDHSLEGLPLVVFGNSAGGFFASILVTRVPAVALILMCSQGQAEVIENANSETFPPTFFNYVGNEGFFDGGSIALNQSLTKLSQRGRSSRRSDHSAVTKLGDDSDPTISMTTKADVEKSMTVLRDRGVMVDGNCGSPRPVAPLFFTERIPCMTGEDSEKIQRAYKAEGWLNSENYLTLDPHDSEWAGPLRKWNAMPAWYEPAKYCPSNAWCQELCPRDVVCQELMKAYAFHGCTGDANNKMYNWVDSILFSSDARRLAVM